MNKCITVICDANEKTGLGHLSRCVNIAINFNYHHHGFLFVFQGNYIKDALKIIKNSGINYKVEKNSIDLNKQCCLVDNYEFNQEQLDELTNKGNKVIVVDDFDTLNYENCALVINFTIDAHLKHPAKNTALGVQYFPAPVTLYSVRKQQLQKTIQEVKNILVFIGGTDHHQIGAKISKQLANIIPHAIINFVSQKTHTFEVENIKQHVIQANLSELLFQADVVVSGGGLLKYESIYCGIPNYAINQTQEQEQDTRKLEKRQLTVNLGMAKYYKDQVKNIKNDVDNMATFKKKMFESIPENSNKLLTQKIWKSIYV